MNVTKLSSFFGEYISGGTGIDVFLINLVFALLMLAFGIFFGKIVTHGLNRFTKRGYFEKNIRPSFVKLTITIIRWAIYIVFFNLALSTLKIPALTHAIIQTLMVAPAIVAALILISIGFAISIYLREIIEDSEITGWKFLSIYLFYFINLIFGLCALKLALIVFDPLISQIVSIMILGIVGISIAYVFVKKELRGLHGQK
jgi:hypothetical protein